eukprot:9698338-Heterocapsa_arctica.AAC.1
MPCVCLDYCFLRDAEQAETLTCLVCRDADTKTVFADVCPKKGALEYSIDQALKNIKKLGYKWIALKTDQEPALVALAYEVMKHWEEETILEHSKVAESASNGV